MIAAVVQVSKLVWKLKTLRLSHSPTPAFGWALSLCNVFSFPSHKARVVICSYVRASVRGMVSAWPEGHLTLRTTSTSALTIIFSFPSLAVNDLSPRRCYLHKSLVTAREEGEDVNGLWAVGSRPPCASSCLLLSEGHQEKTRSA